MSTRATARWCCTCSRCRQRWPKSWSTRAAGKPWAGELPALLQDFNHLGSEAMADVAGGSAPDLALLRALGCTRSHILCTSAQDAEVLLLVAPPGATA
jgi:hypothetical protein